MLVLSACTRQVEASATYPPDVETFIKRAANCNTPHRLDAAGRRQWGCDTLLADKQHIVQRYRAQPLIVEALNGPWIIKTDRVPKPELEK